MTKKSGLVPDLWKYISTLLYKTSSLCRFWERKKQQRSENLFETAEVAKPCPYYFWKVTFWTFKIHSTCVHTSSPKEINISHSNSSKTQQTCPLHDSLFKSFNLLYKHPTIPWSFFMVNHCLETIYILFIFHCVYSDSDTKHLSCIYSMDKNLFYDASFIIQIYSKYSTCLLIFKLYDSLHDVWVFDDFIDLWVFCLGFYFFCKNFNFDELG